MPTQRFQLKYAGDELRDGTMNAVELSSALAGLADLIQDSNRLLNGDRAGVDIRVNADFRKGSFEIQLLLDQHIFESTRAALEFMAVVDAKNLLDQLFGAALEHGDKLISGCIIGLIALYKALKGKKPKPENIIIKDNHGVINIDQREIHVDGTTLKLYLNDPIRNDIDKMLLPVAKDGVDSLTVTREGAELNEVKKEDLPERVTSDAHEQSSDRPLRNTREALLKVATANFEKGKWRFSDGGTKFSANIADPVFQAKLDSREEGFYKGDVLHVMLESEQTESANGRIQTKYTIKEVLEHRKTGEQQFLLSRRIKSGDES
jgi:hypothetical protein